MSARPIARYRSGPDRAVLEGSGARRGLAAVKAVQFGGPTGALLRRRLLWIRPSPTRTMEDGGLPCGSATIEVFGSGSLRRRNGTRRHVATCEEQSCGKCVVVPRGHLPDGRHPGRHRGVQGRSPAPGSAARAGEAMKTGSICGLGKNGLRPGPEQHRALRRTTTGRTSTTSAVPRVAPSEAEPQPIRADHRRPRGRGARRRQRARGGAWRPAYTCPISATIPTFRRPECAGCAWWRSRAVEGLSPRA